MHYQFCPKCGSATSMKQVEDQHLPVCTQQTCSHIFWQNSKPCASVVIENHRGEVLFAIRAGEPEKGKLDLPGGFLHLSEHPFDGARREIHEELGVDIEIERILGFAVDTYAYATEKLTTLNIALLCRLSSETPITPADDVASVIWLDPTKIDLSSLAFNNNAEIIRLYLANKAASL